MMNCSSRFFHPWLYFVSLRATLNGSSKVSWLESVENSSTYWLDSAEVVMSNIGKALNRAAPDVAYLDDGDRRSAAAASGETEQEQVGLWLKQQQD